MNHFPVLLLITVAALMHPLQYDLRSSAAKGNSITYVLRMQPLRQATLTQPFQCDLQRLSYVLLCDLPPCIISSRRILFVRNTEVLLPNFL